MSGSADEVASATGQVVERGVSFEHDVGVFVDGFEDVPDHFAVQVAESGRVLDGAFAHLDASRVERHVAVLWGRYEEDVLEVLECRLLAQFEQERLVWVCVVFEAQL